MEGGSSCTCEKIIQAYHGVSTGKERFNQMTADEPGATCNNDIFHQERLPLFQNAVQYDRPEIMSTAARGYDTQAPAPRANTRRDFPMRSGQEFVTGVPGGEREQRMVESQD